MRTTLLMTVMLLGCSGGDGEDDETFMCARADRAGTYVAHFVERPNGTCGAIPDTVVRLDPNGALGEGCTLDAPDTWSSDECRLDRSMTCCEAQFCTSLVATSEQQDESGERLTGLVSMQIVEIGLSGTVLDGCASAYDVSWTRQ